MEDAKLKKARGISAILMSKFGAFELERALYILDLKFPLYEVADLDKLAVIIKDNQSLLPDLERLLLSKRRKNTGFLPSRRFRNKAAREMMPLRVYNEFDHHRGAMNTLKALLRKYSRLPKSTLDTILTKYGLQGSLELYAKVPSDFLAQAMDYAAAELENASSMEQHIVAPRVNDIVMPYDHAKTLENVGSQSRLHTVRDESLLKTVVRRLAQYVTLPPAELPTSAELWQMEIPAARHCEATALVTRLYFPSATVSAYVPLVWLRFMSSSNTNFSQVQLDPAGVVTKRVDCVFVGDIQRPVFAREPQNLVESFPALRSSNIYYVNKDAIVEQHHVQNGVRSFYTFNTRGNLQGLGDRPAVIIDDENEKTHTVKWYANGDHWRKDGKPCTQVYSYTGQRKDFKLVSQDFCHGQSLIPSMFLTSAGNGLVVEPVIERAPSQICLPYPIKQVGATCWAASILNILFNTKPLRNYLRSQMPRFLEGGMPKARRIPAVLYDDEIQDMLKSRLVLAVYNVLCAKNVRANTLYMESLTSEMEALLLNGHQGLSPSAYLFDVTSSLGIDLYDTGGSTDGDDDTNSIFAKEYKKRNTRDIPLEVDSPSGKLVLVGGLVEAEEANHMMAGFRCKTYGQDRIFIFDAMGGKVTNMDWTLSKTRRANKLFVTAFYLRQDFIEMYSKRVRCDGVK